MTSFDDIKVGPDLARLQRAFVKQVSETAGEYITGACPTGDRSAIERFICYLERQGSSASARA